MENGVMHYNNLLALPYNEAVELLLSKYGSAQDDYFRENSYKRFLNGEIKHITKGKYSRTGEGLCCHHIDENIYENLGDQDYISKHKYPFEPQKKDRLVYCDSIEHLILHALITKETDGAFGYGGYSTYLRLEAYMWYILKMIPEKSEWKKNCFDRAFLSPKQTEELFSNIDSFLPEAYHISYRNPYQDMEERKRMREESKIRMQELERQNAIDEEKHRIDRINFFNSSYPKLKELNYDLNTSRQKLLNHLYDLKYNKNFSSKKEFRLSMNSVVRSDILEELNSLLTNE